MGLIYADLVIYNTEDIMAYRRKKIDEADIKKTTVRALVDTGAYMLCINENIKKQLDLIKIDEVEMELANGQLQMIDVVGPVEIRFKTRRTTVDAALLPGNSEVLLGSIPMEDMDVILNPKKQTIEVNPETPYVAKKKLK